MKSQFLQSNSICSVLIAFANLPMSICFFWYISPRDEAKHEFQIIFSERDKFFGRVIKILPIKWEIYIKYSRFKYSFILLYQKQQNKTFLTFNIIVLSTLVLLLCKRDLAGWDFGIERSFPGLGAGL